MKYKILWWLKKEQIKTRSAGEKTHITAEFSQISWQFLCLLFARDTFRRLSQIYAGIAIGGCLNTGAPEGGGKVQGGDGGRQEINAGAVAGYLCANIAATTATTVQRHRGKRCAAGSAGLLGRLHTKTLSPPNTNRVTLHFCLWVCLALFLDASNSLDHLYTSHYLCVCVCVCVCVCLCVCVSITVEHLRW